MPDEKQVATEKQVRTNIDVALHEEMTRAARRLGLHIKDFVAEAIKAKLGKLDVDLRCKRLSAENTTLSAEKEQFRDTRDTALQRVETAEKRVSEIRAECDRLAQNNTSLTIERDAAREERDTFRAKFEESVESIGKLEADLKAYKERGFWDRVFNRKATA